MNALIMTGAIKKFRRTPWRFQATFQTPLDELDRFISVVLSTEMSIEQSIVVIDQVVFDAENLKALLPNNQSPTLGRDLSFEAVNRQETHMLLHAAFSDWIDFAFIPSPKPFVIYADHDEYTTFYANTKSNLNSVVSGLVEKGFRQVTNWKRNF